MRNTADMAREAFGIVKGESWNSGFWTVAHEELKAFEALVRADEREAVLHLAVLHGAPWHFQEAIRARGNT
jgi:hypothetical protein